METPVFELQEKKFTEESTVITMRLPADLVRDLDEAARLSRRSRNEIMEMALEFSFDHLRITKPAPPKETDEKLLL